jgi:hypothetical protein
MVFVQNRTAGSITVQITNTSGGSADTFTLPSNFGPGGTPESFSGNHWGRTGFETVTVNANGKRITINNVNKDEVITVYTDCYERHEGVITKF